MSSWQESTKKLVSKLVNKLNELKAPPLSTNPNSTITDVNTKGPSSLGLLDVLHYTPCLNAIMNIVQTSHRGSSLLILNLTCKVLYKIICPLLSNHFMLRITDDLPFPRRTITSIILYNFKLPCRETLLSPPAIKRVHLIEYSHMPSNYLPDSVTRLSLSSSHNLSITPHLLPLSLTHLHLPAAFNGEVDDLPQMLTHLKFGYEFNQPVDHLPQGITHLIFGTVFNQPINCLPPALVLLCTGREFDYPTDSLPRTLQFLRLGQCFSHSINNLPDTLIFLQLKNGIHDSSVKLPPHLKSLKLSAQQQPLPPLPSTLTILDISTRNNAAIYPHGDLPQSLHTFQLSGQNSITLAQLPSSISTLHLFVNFSVPVDNLQRFNAMTSLYLPRDFSQNVDGKLPPNLHALNLGEKFNYCVDELPANLSYLYIGTGFNQPLNNLPRNLSTLTIEALFYTQLITSLPANLSNLTILGLANCSLLDFIPSKVQHLNISVTSEVLHRTVVQNLPSTLTFLTLATTNKTILSIVNFPPSLLSLSLSGSCEIVGRFNTMLPDTLVFLSLYAKFNKRLDVLPLSLTDLYVDSEFNQPLPPLPPKLRSFELTREGAPQTLKFQFPPRMFHVKITWKYQDSLWNGTGELMPATCHNQRESRCFYCSLCEDRGLYAGYDLMSGDGQNWIDAVCKGLWRL